MSSEMLDRKKVLNEMFGVCIWSNSIQYRSLLCDVPDKHSSCLSPSWWPGILQHSQTILPHSMASPKLPLTKGPSYGSLCNTFDYLQTHLSEVLASQSFCSFLQCYFSPIRTPHSHHGTQNCTGKTQCGLTRWGVAAVWFWTIYPSTNTAKMLLLLHSHTTLVTYIKFTIT